MSENPIVSARKEIVESIAEKREEKIREAIKSFDPGLLEYIDTCIENERMKAAASALDDYELVINEDFCVEKLKYKDMTLGVWENPLINPDIIVTEESNHD